MTVGEDRRLVGWKAISKFLGRDVRTARRWELERGLPLHRVPGGGSATVWADPDALRVWMEGERSAPAPAPLPDQRPSRLRRWWIVGALTAIAVPTMVYGVVSWTTQREVLPVAPFGADVAANETYRTARYAMDKRSVPGLFDALSKFDALSRQYPGRAEPLVGLAETHLLLREFNSIPEETSYRRATIAAERALALEPRSAGAMRALGFIRYWSAGDRDGGLDLLRRATLVEPDDAQSLHWYGTALLGEGRFADAMTALNRAHVLNPGSSAIAADAAYASYMAGRRDDAIAQLREIVKLDPDFTAAHRYLERFYLIEGNDADFLKHAARTAQLQANPERAATIAAAAQAFAKGGRSAMLTELITRAERRAELNGASAIDVAQLYAAKGDRAGVLRWLDRAATIRQPEIKQLIGYPDFVPYRNDPAFKRYFDRQ